MRQLQFLLAVVGLLCGCGIALAADQLALTATIGFGGYYRPRTLVPIAVKIHNNIEKTVSGEFHITSQTERVFPRHYTAPVTIPSGTTQLMFLYVTPQVFAKDVTVEFWQRGEKLQATQIINSQELYDTGRLMVVVGGTGASFSSAGAQQIPLTKQYAVPRSWDYAGAARQQMMTQPRPNNGWNGNVQIAYADRTQLPDNPEAYGSISILALMSTVTENTLSAGAQQAIPLWVASGGHLLIAGGGITSRFQAPFFTGLLAQRNGQPSFTDAQVLTNTNGGKATTERLGAGHVTLLSFDPDNEIAKDWNASTQFYKKLFSIEPETAAPLRIHPAISQAIMVRNLQPPNLTLIIFYLVIYLIMLVPVNYFVLKRIDKRELAWVTTPAIVILFTLGAYGIGYATKGHRLVVNQISVVETSAGQRAAEAVSELLVFSPARTSYSMDMGENGLLVDEVNRDEEQNPYAYQYQQSRPVTSPLTYVEENGHLEVRDISVNMWDFRQFAMLHQLDLRGGFTANLRPGQPGSMPRATGTVTNNTPFRFDDCQLYCNGSLVAEFALSPGKSVTVEQVAGTAFKPSFGEDARHMYDNMQSQTSSLLSAGSSLTNGCVLLGYTTDTLTPARFNNRAPSTTLSLFVVHL